VGQPTLLVGHPEFPRPRPAGIPPPVRSPATPRGPTASRTRDESGHALFGAYRVSELPRRREWRTRRRCSPWSGHLTAVERAVTARMGAQSQGGVNAPKNARNGVEERENRADRGVTAAPTHSVELY